MNDVITFINTVNTSRSAEEVARKLKTKTNLVVGRIVRINKKLVAGGYAPIPPFEKPLGWNRNIDLGKRIVELANELD